VGRVSIPFIVLALLIPTGCGGGNRDGGGADAAASTRCESVPQDLVDGIASGLTVDGGGTLRNAQAVRSDDFQGVYFISAEIDGPGMEGDGEVGTWAKSGPLAVGDGLVMSVDSIANELSDWGDGGSSDAQLSMSDDGAEASKDCVGG
jgi:hypothetical protein